MNKLDYDIYIAKEKIRMEKGFLTRSEREKLKHMIDNPKSYISVDVISSTPKGKSIITNIIELRKPCREVTKDDDFKTVISDLRDTLIANTRGLGLSANQIGYNLAISYIKMLDKVDETTKQLKYKEYVLINPEIVEKQDKIVFHDEGCLSLPGIHVNTDRYVFITATYLDEKLEKRMGIFSDLESIAVQHEIDHLCGKTIIDAKHRSV
jgi:peptide deformylase